MSCSRIPLGATRSFAQGAGRHKNVFELTDEAIREIQRINDEHDLRYDDWTIEQTTAAQLIADMKQGDNDNPTNTMPRRCIESAPIEVHRYSDGSQINPQHQAFALAAAGAWLPFPDHDDAQQPQRQAFDDVPPTDNHTDNTRQRRHELCGRQSGGERG